MERRSTTRRRPQEVRRVQPAAGRPAARPGMAPGTVQNVVVAGLVAALLAALPVPAGADTYEIDANHSFFMFRALRMGVVYVYGRFNEFAGTIEMDGEDITSGSITLEVQTSSVDTGVTRRDDHLRSPDFLNAAQLPVMRFESKSVAKTGESTYEISGDLTLHGVTREVTATVEHVGTGQAPGTGKTMIGFDGGFTFQRSDFGMSYMQGPISDAIDVRLAIQAIAR